MTDSLPGDDCVQPFRLGALGLRGRHVRLGGVVDRVLGQHAYPEAVSALLGELMALAAVLASSIKYDGVFTIQTRSEGPVRIMVADVTSDGEVRAYANFDRDAVDEAVDGGDARGPSVPRLLGPGHLAFTVDQGPDTERYQGIVGLEGAALTDCAHSYFRQSEQIPTGIKLASGAANGGWRAGALMLQRVPQEGGFGPAREDDAQPDAAEVTPDTEDDWRRAVVLMSSVTTDELLDPALSSNKLLYRLFHEEPVWVYRLRPLAFGCRCSRERVENTLRMLPRAEVEALRIDGQVTVTCQFCNRSEIFDDAALAALYAA